MITPASSDAANAKQVGNALPVRLPYLAHNNIAVNADHIESIRHIRTPFSLENKASISRLEQWLQYLKIENRHNEAFAGIVSLDWYLCCLKASHLGLKAWKRFRKSEPSRKRDRGKVLAPSLLGLSLFRVKFKNRVYREIESIINRIRIVLYR